MRLCVSRKPVGMERLPLVCLGQSQDAQYDNCPLRLAAGGVGSCQSGEYETLISK